MSHVRLSRLELKIMAALWSAGPSSVREILEQLPKKDRPAHTTVLTVLTRLEKKQAVRRAKKISNAFIYEAVVTRASTQRLLVDDLLVFFGGRAAPLVSHLIETGKLSRQEIEEARRLLKKDQRHE